MKALADLLPQLLWALSIATHVYLYLQHGTHKGNVMSEDLDPTAPVPTALAEPSAAAAVAFHPAVAPVVQAVQSTMAPESNWATTAASVLQALMPVVQPAEQVGRASVRTQGEVAIGLAALTALLQVFYPHPTAQQQ